MKIRMQVVKGIVLLGIFLSGSSHAISRQSVDSMLKRWVMHSNHAATKWRDAFVTGNGSHGTMVVGQANDERIVCVHEELFLSAWDRSIQSVADTGHLIPKVRELIKQGKDADGSCC